MPASKELGRNLALQDTGIIVIVVNWNTRELLRQCLDSLQGCMGSLRFSVVVVDNGSTDGSIEMIETGYPGYHLVKNRENIGFGKANNLAFTLYPQHSYCLLLNSDATVTPELIQALLNFLKTHKDVGAVGPALMLPDGRFQFGGAGWGPEAVYSCNTFFMLANISRRFRGLFIVQKHYEGSHEPVFVDWLAGACMMIRAQTLADVGGFDERYFVYGEDAEWCWRARSKGWRIAYLPYVSATHHCRGSMVGNGNISTDWFRLLADAVLVTSSGVNYRLFLLFGALGYALRIAVLLPIAIARKSSMIRHRLASYGSLLKESLRLLCQLNTVDYRGKW